MRLLTLPVCVLTIGTLVGAMAYQPPISITLRLGEIAYYMHQVPEVRVLISKVELSTNRDFILASRSHRRQPICNPLYCFYDSRLGKCPRRAQ